MPYTLQIVQRFFPQVQKVVDATRDQAIEVLPSDAASEGKKNHAQCAMAVACKRALHLDGVIISRTTAYLIKGKLARRFMLPVTVAREITSYDRGAGFSVGKYHLARIPKSRTIGFHKGGKDHEGNRNGKGPKYRHVTNRIRTVLGGPEPDDQ